MYPPPSFGEGGTPFRHCPGFCGYPCPGFYGYPTSCPENSPETVQNGVTPYLLDTAKEVGMPETHTFFIDDKSTPTNVTLNICVNSDRSASIASSGRARG